MSKNKYKSLADLANYLNGTLYFSNRWISVKKIMETFEKVHLLKKVGETYEPTDFFKNSNGCFMTKSGKILFTEKCWKLMTEDTKQYTKDEWLDWFISVYNSNEKYPLKDCRLPKRKYLANLDNGLIVIASGYSAKDVQRRLAQKYRSYCVAKLIVRGKKNGQ